MTACYACHDEPSNVMTLLWDVATDERYCADQAACRARIAGQSPTTSHDHGRCESWATTHGSTVQRCIRDHGHHDTAHRDSEGREWSQAA